MEANSPPELHMGKVTNTLMQAADHRLPVLNVSTEGCDSTANQSASFSTQTHTALRYWLRLPLLVTNLKLLERLRCEFALPLKVNVSYFLSMAENGIEWKADMC